MKHFILFFIFNLCSNTVYTQNKSVFIQYLVNENTNNSTNNKKFVCELAIKDNESVYRNNVVDSINHLQNKELVSKAEKVGEFTQITFANGNSILFTQDFFYKNYKKDTLLFNEFIPFSTKVYVGENLRIFDWQILAVKDSLILGFKCKTATTNFRGRKYIAYFCPDIYLFGGPWKFDGLPGLILAVKSEDNRFVIEPLKIALNTLSEPIENPYKNLPKEKIFSWQKYKEIYEKKLIYMQKKSRNLSDDGTGVTFGIRDSIEDLGVGIISYDTIKQREKNEKNEKNKKK